MSSFLKGKKSETMAKCAKCRLHNHETVLAKNPNNILVSTGKDLLVVLEMAESPAKIAVLQNFLKKYGIQSYTIVSGLQCSTKEFALPSPIYKIYRTCDTLTKFDVSDYKAVVTIGRAINAITQSDDITSYADFYEYLFNQTYFYTSIHEKKPIRVYPVPPLTSILIDDFNNFFYNRQFEFLSSYLKANPDEVNNKYELEVVKDFDKFLLEHNEPEFAIDTETSGLDAFVKDFKVICVTISFDGHKGYFIPFNIINKEKFSAWLKGKKQIYANGKFDIVVLRRQGIENLEVSEDVNLMFHFLSTVRRTNGLKTLAWLLGFGGYDRTLQAYIEKNRIKSYADIPLEVLKDYAVVDAVVTKRLKDFGMRLMRKQPGAYQCYQEYVIQALPSMIDAHLEGMDLDFTYVEDLTRKLKAELVDLRMQINALMGDIVCDINSIEQLGYALEKMGLPDYGRTKKGFYQTGVEVLQLWKRDKYEIADLLLKYRRTNKLIDSFLGEEEQPGGFLEKRTKEEEVVEGILKFVKDDGKLHPVVNLGYADSFRSTSYNPNIQQMPKHGEEGKMFRPSFKCPDGYYICEADYSGFQLRIAAIYSKDPALIDVFVNQSGDLHSKTAQGLFARDITFEEFLKRKKEEPYKTFRFRAKSVAFSYLFGAGPMTLVPALKTDWSAKDIVMYLVKLGEIKQRFSADFNFDKYVTDEHYLEVAKDIRKKFFETYPVLLEWIEAQPELAKNQGYIQFPMGGRRHIPQLKYVGAGSDKAEVKNWGNISINSQVQSFEAMLVNKALTKIHREIKLRNLKSKLVATVHDSIVLYIKKEEAIEMYHLLKTSMEDLTSYIVPITAEVEYGTVWGFGEEVTEANLSKFAA